MSTSLRPPDTEIVLQLAHQIASQEYSRRIVTFIERGNYHAGILACRSARLEACGRAHNSDHNECELIGKLAMLLERLLLQGVNR